MSRPSMLPLEACTRADQLRQVSSSLCAAKAVQAVGLAPVGGDIVDLERQTAAMLRDFGEALGLHMPAVDELLRAPVRAEGLAK